MTALVNIGLPYIGEVRMFAGDQEPHGWAFCDGRLLPIQYFADLYGVIGTTYGGDGVNNFAVPDLRGRIPVGKGQGPGLANRSLGQQVGAETVNLTVANLPAHNHAVQASSAAGNQTNPVGNTIAASAASNPFVNTGPTGTMATSTGNTGSGTAVPIVQPSLTLNFIIATEGLNPYGEAARLISGPQP